jgi:hypothetical protein
MRFQAFDWVIRCSPYKGTKLVLHLAIADSANDLHDNEVWLEIPDLALKARQSRGSVIAGLKHMVADGFLELIETQHGTAGVARYRLLFPEETAMVGVDGGGAP